MTSITRTRWIVVAAAAIAAVVVVTILFGKSPGDMNISGKEFGRVGSAGLNTEEEVSSRFGDDIDQSDIPNVRGLGQGCRYYYYNDAVDIVAEICFADNGEFRAKRIKHIVSTP